MLNQGIQDFIKSVGGYGCYALTLCKIAETEAALTGRNGLSAGVSVTYIQEAVCAGCIKPDMTVLDGVAFLKALTGMKWSKEYKDAGYKPVKGDYLCAEWYNKRTGLTHFTLKYPEEWNSLRDSVTVREGVIRSYRLYRVEEL